MFAKVADGVWTPGIGDPTFGGWLTVAGYFAAAFLAWTAAGRAHLIGDHDAFREQRWFWMIMGGLLIFLGINKQLDLQTGMTWLLKQWSLEQGWYEERRRYQAVFIAGIGLCGAGLLGLLLWLVRRRFPGNGFALAGAIFLVCFVLIRASSFHYVDRMLGLSLGGLKVNWLLEWSGIVGVLLGAGRALRAAPGRTGAEAFSHEKTLRDGRE